MSRRPKHLLRAAELRAAAQGLPAAELRPVRRQAPRRGREAALLPRALQSVARPWSTAQLARAGSAKQAPSPRAESELPQPEAQRAQRKQKTGPIGRTPRRNISIDPCQFTTKKKGTDRPPARTWAIFK